MRDCWYAWASNENLNSTKTVHTKLNTIACSKNFKLHQWINWKLGHVHQLMSIVRKARGGLDTNLVADNETETENCITIPSQQTPKYFGAACRSWLKTFIIELCLHFVHFTMSKYNYIQMTCKVLRHQNWKNLSTKPLRRSWRFGSGSQMLPAFPQSRKCQARYSAQWQPAGSKGSGND